MYGKDKFFPYPAFWIYLCLFTPFLLFLEPFPFSFWSSVIAILFSPLHLILSFFLLSTMGIPSSFRLSLKGIPDSLAVLIMASSISSGVISLPKISLVFPVFFFFAISSLHSNPHLFSRGLDRIHEPSLFHSRHFFKSSFEGLYFH